MLLTLGAHQLGHKVSVADVVAGPFLAPTGAVSVAGGTLSGAIWPLGAGSGAIDNSRNSGEVIR